MFPPKVPKKDFRMMKTNGTHDRISLKRSYNTCQTFFVVVKVKKCLLCSESLIEWDDIKLSSDKSLLVINVKVVQEMKRNDSLCFVFESTSYTKVRVYSS